MRCRMCLCVVRAREDTVRSSYCAHDLYQSSPIIPQRPDRTIDIEAGLGHYRELEEEAKKGEAGFHPIVAHLWTIVR